MLTDEVNVDQCILRVSPFLKSVRRASSNEKFQLRRRQILEDEEGRSKYLKGGLVK